MKKIIKLSGVSVENDALPFVAASEVERTLAGIPGLFAWIQAGAAYQGPEGSLMDRASGQLLEPNASTGHVEQSSFPGGADALQFPRPLARYRGVTTEFAPDRWSIATVLQTSSESTTEELVSAPIPGTAGEFNVRLGFTNVSNRGLRLWSGDGSTRWTVPGQGWDTEPMLIVVTFSVEQGFRMRANGAEFASEPDDRAPLMHGEWQIGAQAGGTGSTSSQAFNGKLGHLMMFNEDLSAVRNTGYLRVLERILMDRYGIS